MSKFQLNTDSLAPKKRRSLSRITQQTREDELLVLDELKQFIRPHKPHEYEQLKKNIQDEGVRDALVAWQDQGRKVLIDGHHRWLAIRELREEGALVDYRVELKEFGGIEEVKDWMIDNQLGRRNLTDPERKYLVGLYYRREKQGHGGARKASGQIDHLKKSEEIARREGMAEKTVRRAADYSQGLDRIAEQAPELKEKILTGGLRVSQSDVQAVGTGKKTANELVEALSATSLSQAAAGSQKTGQPLKMPVKQEFLAKEFSDKDISRVNTIHGKFEQQIVQLLKLGFDKTQIRWMFSQTLKETGK